MEAAELWKINTSCDFIKEVLKAAGAVFKETACNFLTLFAIALCVNFLPLQHESIWYISALDLCPIFIINSKTATLRFARFGYSQLRTIHVR